MLPIKIRGSYFIIVLFLFLFIPTSVSAHWFQTISGDVYTNGSLSIAAPQAVPTPTPANYFLSLNNIARGSSGIIFHNSGSSNTARGSQDDPPTETNPVRKWVQRRVVASPPNPASPLTVVAAQQQNYLDSMENSFNNNNNLNISAGSGDQNPSTYCFNGLNSGSYVYTGASLTIDCASGSFGPISGHNVVIFVNGPVMVRDPIVVPPSPDTFFMLVSKTSITFSNSVSNVAGVFIAPTITTSDNPAVNAPQLVGEGVFYALNTLNLNRHTASQATPAEVFTFRPSFMLAAPRNLWDTFVNYEEIEP